MCTLLYFADLHSTFRLLYSEYTSCPFKGPSSYSWAATCMFRCWSWQWVLLCAPPCLGRWCRAGENRGQQWQRKQEEPEEEGCEHTLQSRELVIDNTKSNRYMPSERCRILLDENPTQKTPSWTKSCMWEQNICCSWNRSECNFHQSISYWDYSLGLKITAFCQDKAGISCTVDLFWLISDNFWFF